MVTPELPNSITSPHRLSVSLAATGWAACIAIWFGAMAATAIWAPEGSMGAMIFAGGLVALVVVRLTGARE